jgi:TRAP transporter TAXI family solute receptor
MGVLMVNLFRVLLFVTAIAGADGAFAQTSQIAPQDQQLSEQSIKERKNAGTVGLACGQLGAAYGQLGQDLAKVLDDGYDLRVIPMITYGSAGNVEDLLYLKNVDIAFIKADNLEYYKQILNVNLSNRLHYITRLYDAELHILVRPEIQSLEDLQGKKVNIGLEGNAAHTTVPIVLKELGIEIETVTVDHAIGLEMMKKGEISAAMRVGGKPMSTFTKLPEGTGFRFLSIGASQFAQHFADKYVLGKLTSEDYPTLIKEGETITTIAVPDILAVYNWPKGTDRYQRAEKFISAFFKKFNKLQEGPFHEKWKDVNLAASIPGWTRSEIAERLLREMASSEGGGSIRNEFDAFLNARASGGNQLTLSTVDKETLFREFLSWRNGVSQ